MKPREGDTCYFDRGGACYALACYSSETCGARDDRGFPKYAETEKCKRDSIQRKDGEK
ncbi:MAG: hypothetical protein V2A34_00265 [Lentisphaerota bacterium]